MSGFIMNLHLIVTIGLVIFPMSARSMRFDLRSGAIKCISEDIMSNAMSVGKYSVVNPNEGFPVPDSHKITVRVMPKISTAKRTGIRVHIIFACPKRVNSPHGVKHHHGDHVEAGNFAFTGAEPGDYTACFWAPDHKPPVTVVVDFDWRTGVAAIDWSNVAKKGQIEEMELELKKLHATVVSIHDEMFYLREREEEMQLLNRATNSKMATFSFLSLVVCLSVAGLQLWHLKTFFERKKLL